MYYSIKPNAFCHTVKFMIYYKGAQRKQLNEMQKISAKTSELYFILIILYIK